MFGMYTVLHCTAIEIEWILSGPGSLFVFG